MEGGPQQDNLKQIFSTTSALPSLLRLKMTEDVSRCQQPPVTGMCRAMYHMWYYDSANTTCRRFIYGGCGGNDNNFPSEDHCRAACPGDEAWMVYIWVAIGVFLLLVVVVVVWMLVHYCSKQSNSFYTTYTASSPMKKSESPSCLLSPELYTPGKFTEFSSLHV
nr:kunitz-type protease inhibitor 1-like isoform X2 [Cherax quadricarinatus]